MPNYVYECTCCGGTKEEFHSVADREDSGLCVCGGNFRIVIQPVRVIGEVFSFTPHYDYQLGQHFQTGEEKRRYLETHNLKQTSGGNSPNYKEGMRVPCTKEQSKKLASGEVNPYEKKIQVTVKG